MNISIKTFSQRLVSNINTQVEEILKEETNSYKNSVSDITKQWYTDIRNILSTPASNRGFFKQSKFWLGLHDKDSYNNSFPMMVTGHLRNALKYNIRVYKVSNGYTISITHKFNPVISKSGINYVDYLNTEHPLLRGYQDRVWDELDIRLREGL